jgi:serine/threonine-protein kinase HipA
LKLNVHVLGRRVGILEQVGDFKSVMAYVPDVAPENLVSLTMPVRTESYPWDDQLHPIFQMNLPEGYLLQVLQEEFGPHIGASPVALLSVIGRNMVGRLQVAPPGAALDEPAKPIEVAELLKGDNSEQASSERPVLYGQITDSSELTRIVRNQHQAEAARMSSNEQIVCIDHGAKCL